MAVRAGRWRLGSWVGEGGGGDGWLVGQGRVGWDGAGVNGCLSIESRLCEGMERMWNAPRIWADHHGSFSGPAAGGIPASDCSLSVTSSALEQVIDRTQLIQLPG